MRKPFASLVAGALGGLLLAGAARADFSSTPWSYNASGSTDTSAATTDPKTGKTTFVLNNTNNPLASSDIKFTGSTGVATGNSGIIIFNMVTEAPAFTGTPDSFDNAKFNLDISLNDVSANKPNQTGNVKASDTVHFTGFFNATNVTPGSLLPGDPVVTWQGGDAGKAQSVVLGSDETGWRTYSLKLTSFTPPGQPGGDPGSILAIVSIDNGNPPDNGGGSGGGGGGGGGTETSPEPASLVLAGLGLPVVVIARRRRQKAQAAA